MTRREDGARRHRSYGRCALPALGRRREKWSEYERGGFHLVVIGDELRLSELSPVERMKYRCKHRRLVDRWRDMRLEGSKLDGVVDADALDEGRKLGLFEDMVA